LNNSRIAALFLIAIALLVVSMMLESYWDCRLLKRGSETECMPGHPGPTGLYWVAAPSSQRGRFNEQFEQVGFISDYLDLRNTKRFSLTFGDSNRGWSAGDLKGHGKSLAPVGLYWSTAV